MNESYYVNLGFSQPVVKTLLNSLEQHICDQNVLIHAAWRSILPLFKHGTNVPHYALDLKTIFPAMPGLAPASIYNILCVKTLVVVNMLGPWLHYVRYLCWKLSSFSEDFSFLTSSEKYLHFKKIFLRGLKVLPNGLKSSRRVLNFSEDFGRSGDSAAYIISACSRPGAVARVARLASVAILAIGQSKRGGTRRGPCRR